MSVYWDRVWFTLGRSYGIRDRVDGHEFGYKLTNVPCSSRQAYILGYKEGYRPKAMAINQLTRIA